MLINGQGEELEELGIAPLVAAILAPIAVKMGQQAASSVGGKLLSAAGLAPKAAAAPVLPPCGFMDRLSKLFGGKPRCT